MLIHLVKVNRAIGHSIFTTATVLLFSWPTNFSVMVTALRASALVSQRVALLCCGQLRILTLLETSIHGLFILIAHFEVVIVTLVIWLSSGSVAACSILVMFWEPFLSWLFFLVIEMLRMVQDIARWDLDWVNLLFFEKLRHFVLRRATARI